MRPPWASTSPLQMASPSPDPPSPRPSSAPLSPLYFSNRCGNRSGATPRPSSVTDTATCAPSRTAATRMGDASGEWRAALARRLFNTCTMRCRSAITRGRSWGRSMRTVWRLPPLRNVVLAWSTRTARCVDWGVTDRVPLSMRPASSRSPMRARMWSACSSMMRKNWSISAGSSAVEAPSTVAAEPLMEVSGARNSWLTMPRNSNRCRSACSKGVRSCSVTTIEPALPPSAPTGPALTSALMSRPSAPVSTATSARNGSPFPNSFSATSRPSANRQVKVAASRSAERPGLRRPSMIRLASRLSDTRVPLPASNTATPHRRGVVQGLEVRPAPLLHVMGAGVTDGRGRQRREQPQQFFILAGELPPACLAAEIEVADMLASMAHGRRLEALPRQAIRGNAQGMDVGAQISHRQRSLTVSNVLEQPRSIRPFRQLPLLFRSETGAHRVLEPPCVVEGRDATEARAGQRPGALHRFAQRGVEVGAGANAQDRRAQRRGPPRRRPVVSSGLAGVLQCPHPFPEPVDRTFTCKYIQIDTKKPPFAA